MNPDLTALRAIAEALRAMTITWPDGSTDRFRHVDLGYMSRPADNPYVSLHSVEARMPVTRLGQGSSYRARDFEIDAVVNIEYEDPDPQRGFERLTHLRWAVPKHLIESQQAYGVEYVKLDQSLIQSMVPDEGDFTDWGFVGQVLIPLTLVIRGSD